LQHFTTAERRKLNAAGIYSLAEVRENRSVAAGLLKSDRMQSLGLVDAKGNLQEDRKGFGKGSAFKKQ